MAQHIDIQSMTGFGRAEGSLDGLKVTCEMRSLNGRYLDTDLRLPRFLMELDPEIRRLLTDKLERGSVTVIYNIEFGPEFNDPSEIKMNEALAKAYLDKFRSLSQVLGIEFHDPLREIIRIPDVINSSEKSLSDAHKKFVVSLTSAAADKLIEFRKQEGSNTGNKLKDAAEFIRHQLQVVEGEEESRRQGLRDRIYANLQEHIKDSIPDQSRFEQELLIYLEKWDIAEEKQRLTQHLDYFEECLKKEPLGRKLNFISQEMGREMNTMGVKSNHYPMQQAVVLMKEKLEQIKEQVLNLV
ncbi:MAG: YicC family protein [Bacteroidia bacterium]|nr:YicC family protein [Bacteroidia bacterium]